MGSNSLPSGHTDLNRRHPGLKKDIMHGIPIVEVLSTPFRPEIVQDEAPENVKRLASVRETSCVVRE